MSRKEIFTTFKIQPLFDYSILFSLVGFILFVVSGFANYGTVSVSKMIAKAPDYGIGIAMLIVFIHSIAVLLYLIIISRYIKQDVRCWCIRFDIAQYNIIVALCIGYIFFITLGIFIKVDNDTDAHNTFVVIAVIMAVLSSWIHRHAFGERIEKKEEYLWASEFLTAFIITVLSILFIYLEENVLEYFLIGILLIDKKLKIMTLTRTGLLNALDLVVEIALEEQRDSVPTVISQSSIF